MNDPESIADNWEEYTTQDGRKYYHNKITKATTWNEPNCIVLLKKQCENQPKECNWKEFTTPDGKKYYHNKITKVTQWGMPTEYKLFMEFSKNKSSEIKEEEQPKDHQIALEIREEKPMEIVREIKPFQLSSDNEENFRRLLKAADISYNMNWTDTKSIISSHHCFKTLPIQKKLQIFNAHKEEQKKLENEQHTIHYEKSKSSLLDFLKQNANPNSKWEDFRDKILNDEKYSHLDKEDAHSHFNDYFFELHKAIWDTEDKEENEDKEVLGSFYQQHIKSITTWDQSNQILEKFLSGSATNEQEEELMTKLKKTLSRVSPYIKLTAFKNHIEKMEDQLKEEKNKEEKELRHKSRLLREKFREHLIDCQVKEKIFAMTTWSQYLSMELLPLDLKEKFLDINQYKGTTLRDLFYDFVEEKLEREYREQKEKINKLLKEMKVTVEHDTNISTLSQKLHQNPTLKTQLKERYTLHILEEKQAEAIELRKEKTEKLESAAKRVYDYFVYDYIDRITPQTTWEQAYKWISNRSAYQTLFSHHSEAMAQEKWNIFFKKFSEGEFKKDQSETKRQSPSSPSNSPSRHSTYENNTSSKRKNTEKDEKNIKKYKESKDKNDPEEEGEIREN